MVTIALQYIFGLEINLFITFFPPKQQIQTHDDNKCTYNAENLWEENFRIIIMLKIIYFFKKNLFTN